MFLMWIIPLLLIGLAVYVISGKNLTNALNAVAPRTCPDCGQALQSDWKACPHCGQTL
jgi:tRNA(Ile2) C34 agmatinyltransferase TiaS